MFQYICWKDHLFPHCSNLAPLLKIICVVIVQRLRSVQLFATPWAIAHQIPLSSSISWSLLTFMSIELVMLSKHLIFCHPLLLLPSIFPSIRIFSNESALHIRSQNYWSFSNSPSNEYLGSISFRIDWFDFLAVQGTLKRVFSSTTIHKYQFFGTQRSLIDIVQLLHPYLTTGKTIALTIQTFAGKVMSLLFNVLSLS